MSAEAVPAEPEGSRSEYEGVLRFYHLAKHQEWQVDDVPWGEIPFVPEGKGIARAAGRGAATSGAPVIMQQLQADVFACEMASQLLAAAPRPRGAPLLLDDGAGRVAPHRGVAAADRRRSAGRAERDPYLDELAHMIARGRHCSRRRSS